MDRRSKAIALVPSGHGDGVRSSYCRFSFLPRRRQDLFLRLEHRQDLTRSSPPRNDPRLTTSLIHALLALGEVEHLDGGVGDVSPSLDRHSSGRSRPTLCSPINSTGRRRRSDSSTSPSGGSFDGDPPLSLKRSVENSVSTSCRRWPSQTSARPHRARSVRAQSRRCHGGCSCTDMPSSYRDSRCRCRRSRRSSSRRSSAKRPAVMRRWNWS